MCALPQAGPCVSTQNWNSTLNTSHCTLHTPHFTYQISSQLISSHLSSAHLPSAHLFASHLISFHMSSMLFSTAFISSEHCSTFLLSQKLFLTNVSSSVRQKANLYTIFFAGYELHRSICTEKLLDANALTQKSFYTQKLLPMASFYAGEPLHKRTFCTKTLLHRDNSTHSSFYTETILHTVAFTQKPLYA